MINLTPNVRRFLGLDEFDAQQQAAPPDEISAPVTPVDSSQWDAAQQPTAGAGGQSWAPPIEDTRAVDEGPRESGPAPWTPISPNTPEPVYEIVDGRSAPPTPNGDWQEMRTVPKPQQALVAGRSTYEDEGDIPYAPPPTPPRWDRPDSPVMQQSAPRPAYGQVVATPGEPDYVRPRDPWEPTSTERRSFEEGVQMARTGRRADGSRVGESILPAWAVGPANHVLGAASALGTASDAVFSRLDPIFQGAFAVDGIVEAEFSEEEKARFREFQEREAQTTGVVSVGGVRMPANLTGGRVPGVEPLTPAEQAEYDALQRRAQARYAQIADNPDAVTQYSNESPAKWQFGLVSAAGTMWAGGAAKGAATAGARALGAGTRTAKAAGYAADIAVQSAADPTNVVVQPGVDAGIKGIGSAVRGLRALPDALAPRAGGAPGEVQLGSGLTPGMSDLRNAAQGGVVGAMSEQMTDEELTPGERLRRIGTGAALGVAAGRFARGRGAASARRLGSGMVPEGEAQRAARLSLDDADSVVKFLAIRHDALNGPGVAERLAGMTPDELRQTFRQWHAQGVFPEMPDARAFDDEVSSALAAAERDAAGRMVDPSMERAGYGRRATGDDADASPMSGTAAENRRFGDDGYTDRFDPDAPVAPEIPRAVDDAPRDNSFSLNAINPASGAAAGAAGADATGDENLTPEERAQRAAMGAVIGAVVGRRPKGQSAAAAADPIMQRMARQMAGQHSPSPIVNRRSLAQRWAQAWTDDRAGIRTFQEAVSARIGRPLRADESLAELTRVNPNSVASQRLAEELRPALSKVGEDEDYLAQYLVHTHNVDVAREMGQRAYDAAIAAGRSPQQASQAAMRAANTRQFSGDLRLNDTLAQLQAIEQRVRSLPDGAARWQAIRDGAQAVWDFNRTTLERRRDAGMIDPALFQELSQRYPHYVRTDIADYFEKGGSGPAPGGKRIGVSDIGIQKIGAEGTTKERVNPLLSMIDQAYTAETAIVRNRAGQAFEELLRLDPDWQSTFREVVPAQGVNRGNPATTVPSSYTLKAGEQKLTVWQNGQPRTYIVPPEYAALVSPQAGRIFGDAAPVQLLRSAMNAYKSLITSKNPAFAMLVSPIRDAGDYAIREMALSAKDGGIKGAGQAVAALPGVMGDYFRALPDVFAGLTQGQFKGDLATLMREGAGMGSRPGHNQRELRQALNDLTRTNGLQVRNLDDIGRIVGNVLTLGAEPIGGRLEQVPRLAAARRAERRGAPVLGQVMSARDATVDFQRAGEWARVLNTAIPFLNVSIQSGAQTARLIRKNPAATLASVATAVGVPAIAAEVWNNSDEQRARDYQDVPDYLKKTGLVIMLPGVEGTSERGDRLPNYVWLPVGQFGTLLQAAKVTAQNAVTKGGVGPEENSVGGWANLGKDLAAEGFGIFSPIRGESAGAMLSSLVPPGLGTGLELAANKDLFRGSTIATDRRDESASALAQGSAGAWNAVTGMESRPSQWDYLYRDLGGYGATLAGSASNMLAEAMGMRQPKQEDRPAQSAPIVGGLINRLVRDAGGQRLENATEDGTRVPEGVRDIMAEVGLRREQITPVPSKYKGAPLTREEQEQWQQTTNDLIERKVAQAARSSEYRARGADQQKIIQQAVSDAKEEAATRALRRLTESEIERRKRSEQQRKAS